MNTVKLKGDFILLVAAAIWGFAFVAQRAGMEYIGPFAFNGIRFALGALSLLPLMMYMNRGQKSSLWSRISRPEVVKAGILAGTFIFAGASLQQIGVIYTSAGKAGFITGLYVIFVPLFGLFWKHKTPAAIWLGAGLAVAGMYLLSITSDFSMGRGDFLVLLGAFFWAAHVLAIGHFTDKMDSLPLAFMQFVVCAVMSLGVALAVEVTPAQQVLKASVPILYAGIMSVGVAYTLQVVGQKIAAPAPAAIILSLEAVFAVLGGWMLLNESLSLREIMGCLLMLTGMIVSQLPGLEKQT